MVRDRARKTAGHGQRGKRKEERGKRRSSSWHVCKIGIGRQAKCVGVEGLLDERVSLATANAIISIVHLGCLSID